MNNILIVEDEHLIARLIEMTLTRAGYRCTLAEDGRTAADLIETTNFDMALLDIIKCTLCQGHYDFFLFRFLFYICLLCRGIKVMPLIDCFHLLL